MTEIEFQNFLSGKCTLRDDINYHWFNLSRDLYFFGLDYSRSLNRTREKNDMVVFSTHDVYMQLFGFNGRLNVDNFNNLVNLSNEHINQNYSTSVCGSDYWRLIKKGSKQDMMRFLEARIITPEDKVEDEMPYQRVINTARNNIVKENCFATIKKLARVKQGYIYCGNTGTHIFSYYSLW